MTQAELSIVMPVLNEAPQIAARLQALQPLRAQGVELIVADGGSSDGTAQLAAPLADRVLAAPRGRAAQMNAGAVASRGRILLFLHADSALPEAALPALRQAIAGGADWGRFDVRIDGRHPLLRIVERMMNWRSRLTGIATGDQAIFVRREVFENLGGYPELPLMEDIALCAALKRRTAPACLREIVTTSARRWERHGVLRTILLMWWLRAAWFLGADPARLARRYGYRPRAAGLDSAPIGIAVMAKAPLAGYAKTRLIPALGAGGAARLQRQLTLRTLATAHAAGIGPVTLWCAPDVRQRFFRALRRRCGLELRVQTELDLGARMAHIFAEHGKRPLLLIGTDCPALTPEHLRQAAQALHDGADAAFITTEDGGYFLVGLRQPVAELFAGIDWSTERVMAQTRSRLSALNLRWRETASLWDVDRAEDVARWQALQQAASSGWQ
ncbi:TIGR04283 family arsenosugar biosynthesis glycosyltransferase [Sulfuritalea sp.]|uniref:TIGR04283 family arsenosugar biosynthesis glycosyltransferase n=1 Tax=Sulfuritalea sp. TaxID=2480090 RepID=UPI00286E0EF9|nr:TIGR04283 family arsenosugar biosynthesis glycosyltransferase [Sulfuritalea sp.]